MKNKKIIIAFSIITVLLSIGVITLGVLFGQSRDKGEESMAMLENHYQQAYYTLLEETNNMEIKFAKLTMTTSKKTQSELLRDVSKSTEVAANAMAALSSADISIVHTMRFINQTGDFAKYLTDRIEDGGELSADQRESISKIYEMLKLLGNELNKVKDKISEGYLFMDNVNDQNNVLSQIFSGLNEASVEYPQLIYDGPFSDALQDKEVKGLSGNDIGEAEGREIIAEIFKDKGVSGIEFSGEWDSDIITLNYTAVIDGRQTTVQLAKKGGSIISLNTYREITNPVLSPDECAVLGRQFLEKLGYRDMSAVWICNDNSTIFVNYAPTLNGVIIYPDLIKVKIASDDGSILGLEARNYAFNHCKRDIAAPAITAAQAKARLSISENASDGKLTLIPYKITEERLAYEFVVETANRYYIYIDAVTGEEINILYVISTTAGDKLI